MVRYLPAPFYNPGETADQLIDKLPIDWKDASKAFAVENSKVPGYSPIFRNNVAKEGIVEYAHPDLKTLYDYIQINFKRYLDKEFLGYRKFNRQKNNWDNFYTYITFREGLKLMDQVGSGISYLLDQIPSIAKSNDPNKRIVSIFLPNVYQFQLIDYGCVCYSIITTTLYDTLGDESIAHCLNLTESPLIFTTKKNLPKIIDLKSKSKIESALKFLIVTEDLSLSDDYDLFIKAKDCGLSLFDFKSLLEIGNKHLLPHKPPNPEDLYSISFTSGTTGLPKGVEVTHFLANSEFLTIIITVEKKDALASFSFLPLAHCFERVVALAVAVTGVQNHMPHDPTNIPSYFEDLRICKPTLFAIVPRVISKIESGLKQKLQGNSYINKIIKWKMERLEKDLPCKAFFFDTFVAPKIKKQLGLDRCYGLVLGSAPVSKETMLYLDAVLNIHLVQGYGATETYCSGFVSSYQTEYGIGTNGVISCNLECRLKNVEDLNYSWESNRSGELLLRGPGVTKGYYKRPGELEKSVDKDGWFQTGDVVNFDEGGNMVVVDRVKNFFKLAQGKYIASEKVEQVYLSSSASILEQFFVTGDSLRHYLVGIGGVSIEFLETFLKDKIEFDFETLKNVFAEYQSNPKTLRKQKIVESVVNVINSPKNKQTLMEIIQKNLSSSPIKLNSFEQVKNCYFTLLPFTVEENTLTPTLKIKRNFVRKNWKEIIDRLYEEGEIKFSSKL